MIRRNMIIIFEILVQITYNIFYISERTKLTIIISNAINGYSLVWVFLQLYSLSSSLIVFSFIGADNVHIIIWFIEFIRFRQFITLFLFLEQGKNMESTYPQEVISWAICRNHSWLIVSSKWSSLDNLMVFSSRIKTAKMVYLGISKEESKISQ